MICKGILFPESNNGNFSEFGRKMNVFCLDLPFIKRIGFIWFDDTHDKYVVDEFREYI